MIIYINNRGEIKDVNSTTQDNLIAIILDDADNPFVGWSVAKICCYRVQIVDGRVAMFTPYVDTRIIEHLDRLSMVDEALFETSSDILVGLEEVYYETTLQSLYYPIEE